MSIDASEGGRVDINGSLPYKGICKKVCEEECYYWHITGTGICKDAFERTAITDTGICKKVFEEGVTLMHDHVGSLAGIYSQKV